jgi:hypothetical protein
MKNPIENLFSIEIHIRSNWNSSWNCVEFGKEIALGIINYLILYDVFLKYTKKSIIRIASM